MTTSCPIPGARGSCQPEGTGALGVLILGEACGEMEARDGLPFRPYAPAGSVLDRAIRRAGFDRAQFTLYNAVPTQPPKNWLDGAPWEAEAIAWGLPLVERLINERKPKCILALGGTALKATTGLAGAYRGVSHLANWVIPSRWPGLPVVPSFHPSYLRRGAMGLLSVLMHDIKLSVAVASGRRAVFHSPVLGRDFHWTNPPLPDLTNPITPAEYITHPTEAQARDFLADVAAHPELLLSYDIETPWSGTKDEEESDELADREILSIQFSLCPGQGIFLPWRHPYDEIARRVLELPNTKAGANTWRFDDPLLQAHGCTLNGVRHDVRWAFHHLQPDIPASLQFISSFYALELGPWKHLHASHKELYGIRDVDVLQRIMINGLYTPPQPSSPGQTLSSSAGNPSTHAMPVLSQNDNGTRVGGGA